MNTRSGLWAFTAAAVFSSLLLLSCSFGSAAEESYGDYPAEDDSVRSDLLLESFPSESDDGVAAVRAGAVQLNADGLVNEEEPSEPSALEEETGDERLRVYNGSAGLIVDNLEETRIYIEKLAKDYGGYVESSYAEYVVIRIPAGEFAEVFETILDIGRLEYSRVETVDVTDAYSDIERLLNTARETRERMYVLLEKSTDPAERARILREIGRLTEEISTLEQQLELMQLRISMSRISIQLIPRSPTGSSREDIPFRWIASLDPLTPAGSRLRARVVLDLGSEWAVFSKDAVYLAENGDRSHLTISTIENNPRGDSAFWYRALMHHLAPYYASATEREFMLGQSAVRGLELVSKDRDPFHYFIGVIPDGKKLHIVEIFSPDGESGFDQIYSAMEKGEIR